MDTKTGSSFGGQPIQTCHGSLVFLFVDCQIIPIVNDQLWVHAQSGWMSIAHSEGGDQTFGVLASQKLQEKRLELL